MFADYSWSELGSIFAMQGFAGLVLFSVLVLMALGLAIIFGQMGVINMAHGEFMILGAYVTYLVAGFFEAFLPALAIAVKSNVCHFGDLTFVFGSKCSLLLISTMITLFV